MTGSGAFLIELGAVRLLESANVARELNRRDLHPETKPEIGNFVFARESRRADFSFDAAFAESARESERRRHLSVDRRRRPRAIPHRSASDRFRNPGSRPRE